MRTLIGLGVVLIMTAFTLAQPKEPPPPPRYGVDADPDVFPQDTAKAALASVVKAIDAKRYTYLAAQLADPDEVDKRVQDLGGKFDAYVKLVAERLTDDPEAIRQLRRFSSEGEINVNGDAAAATHKDIKGKQVALRKIGNRWFLQDRQKAAKPAP
jgi:hypothetical protein